jgi:hypothetical protein
MMIIVTRCISMLGEKCAIPKMMEGWDLEISHPST